MFLTLIDVRGLIAVFFVRRSLSWGHEKIIIHKSVYGIIKIFVGKSLSKSSFLKVLKLCL